ncbi:hypothetical protein RRG08_008045 [Elysia crispata]|uniref:Uncharacterized protein n=1 Tax=Elysia crispata TaxID=231223 RepID=A0AAE1AIK8_9GAST|nr:hypothetical protein RRG08_008045 [Elysia crispata]
MISSTWSEQLKPGSVSTINVLAQMSIPWLSLQEIVTPLARGNAGIHLREAKILRRYGRRQIKRKQPVEWTIKD